MSTFRFEPIPVLPSSSSSSSTRNSSRSPTSSSSSVKISNEQEKKLSQDMAELRKKEEFQNDELAFTARYMDQDKFTSTYTRQDSVAGYSPTHIFSKANSSIEGADRFFAKRNDLRLHCIVDFTPRTAMLDDPALREQLAAQIKVEKMIAESKHDGFLHLLDVVRTDKGLYQIFRDTRWVLVQHKKPNLKSQFAIGTSNTGNQGGGKEMKFSLCCLATWFASKFSTERSGHNHQEEEDYNSSNNNNNNNNSVFQSAHHKQQIQLQQRARRFGVLSEDTIRNLAQQALECIAFLQVRADPILIRNLDCNSFLISTNYETGDFTLVFAKFSSCVSRSEALKKQHIFARDRDYSAHAETVAPEITTSFFGVRSSSHSSYHSPSSASSATSAASSSSSSNVNNNASLIFSPAADIFSFGIFIFILLRGESPVKCQSLRNRTELAESLKKGKYLEEIHRALPFSSSSSSSNAAGAEEVDDYSCQALRDLLLRLLALEPYSRPTAANLVSTHSWLKTNWVASESHRKFLDSALKWQIVGRNLMLIRFKSRTSMKKALDLFAVVQRTARFVRF